MLLIAALVQLPLILLLVARKLDFNWTMPEKVYWLIHVTSVVLGIVGFAIVSRQLSSLDEAPDALPISDFVRKTRVLGSAKIAASAQLLFYIMFLLPLANLGAILVARLRASRAIAGLEAEIAEYQRIKRPARGVTVL